MSDFRFLLNPRPIGFTGCSALLNGYTDGTGPDYRVARCRTTLTIKAVTRGVATYEVGRGRYRVTEDSFLILNDGQEYGLEIDGRSKTETLCPFFQPGLVEHVADCLASRPDRQLDEIDVSSPALGFHERLYPRIGPVAPILRDLQLGVHEGHADTPYLEDRFLALAAALVGLNAHSQSDVAVFPGARLSTRKELCRRLHRGRDFLASCFDEPLTVAMAARVANLSPFHFHRMFKLAFGETPMHYLQACRLDEARRLLIRTDIPVTAISLAVGFESLGSFSWLFRQRFGVSPRRFRAGSAGGRTPQD